MVCNVTLGTFPTALSAALAVDCAKIRDRSTSFSVTQANVPVACNLMAPTWVRDGCDWRTPMTRDQVLAAHHKLRAAYLARGRSTDEVDVALAALATNEVDVAFAALGVNERE